MKLPVYFEPQSSWQSRVAVVATEWTIALFFTAGVLFAVEAIRPALVTSFVNPWSVLYAGIFCFAFATILHRYLPNTYHALGKSVLQSTWKRAVLAAVLCIVGTFAMHMRLRGILTPPLAWCISATAGLLLSFAVYAADGEKSVESKS